jgi:hypothetical protein
MHLDDIEDRGRLALSDLHRKLQVGLCPALQVELVVLLIVLITPWIVHLLELREEKKPSLIVEVPLEEGCFRRGAKSCNILTNQ